MALQEKDVPGAKATELPSETGILDISESQALSLMYGAAFSVGGIYDGPHAFTADYLAEKWGYNSRSSVDKRAASQVEKGIFTKVKIANPDGKRPLNAWVLTEIYEAWEGRDVDSK